MYVKRDALAIRERAQTAELRFSVFDEGKKNVLTAKDTINCDCRDGGLQTAFRWGQVRDDDGTPLDCGVSGATKICYLKSYDTATKIYQTRYCFITESGEVYIQRKGQTAFTEVATGMLHADAVLFGGVDSRKTLAVVGDGMCLFLRDDDTFDIAGVADVDRTGCVFKHRLFLGMKPATLAFSALEDEMNFTESAYGGGFIRFPNAGGELVAIKAFEDMLYLFFEYGILRLEIAGAPKDFAAEALEYTGGRIYGRTVCGADKAIFFLAADGLYRFDGEKAERLFAGFVELPSEETLTEGCARWKNRVFICYQTANGAHKTLVVYEDGKSCFYADGFNALSAEEGGRCLFTDENGVICMMDESGAFCKEGRFFGAETDLGVTGRKTLVQLRFEGEGEFGLVVKNGGRTFSRTVELNNGAAEVKLSERGERFVFDFTLKNGARITKMTARFKTTA